MKKTFKTKKSKKSKIDFAFRFHKFCSKNQKLINDISMNIVERH